MCKPVSLSKISGICILIAALALSACSGLTRLEAENAEALGLTPREHDDASGGVRMVDFHAIGDSLTFNDVPKGKYLLITYSLGETAPRQCSVYIDGKDAATAVFASTGSWDVYQTTILAVPVHGSVMLRIDADDARANGSEYMASIDKIEIGDQSPLRIEPMKEMRAQMLAPLLEEETLPAAAYIETLDVNGAWPDINYRIGRAPRTHLERIRTIAVARQKKELKGEKTDDAIRRATGYWLRENFRETNWWQNTIGIPTRIGEILLLAQEALDPDQISACWRILDRPWPAPEDETGQGENALVRARPALIRAVMSGDNDRLRDVRDGILHAIRVTDRAGIQPDNSFRQYDLLYMGGYGLNFLSDVSEFALYFKDTPCAFPPDKLAILSDFLLDGEQWIVRGLAIDPAAMGRAIVHPAASTMAKYLQPVGQRLIAVGAPRAPEIEAMIERLRNDPARMWNLEGNRFFWRGGLMAHQRKTFYASFRMASNRIAGTEAFDGENLKGYHLPDGTTWIMRRGNEYAGIYPVLDWRRLPGVTATLSEEPLPVPERGSADTGSRAAFAGGVSDGLYGAAAFQLLRPGLQARKAAFFFDTEFVCLGAEIATTSTAHVVTSVNQCLLAGAVDVHAPPMHRRFVRGGSVWENPVWFHHDRIGYRFLAPARVEMHAGSRTGAWKDIDADKSADRQTRDVFSLWIDHGPKPSAAAYAYAVVSDIDAETMPQYVKQDPILVIANDEKTQAVFHKDLRILMACFHTPGRIATPGGPEIAVDRPCLLTWRENEGALTVAVADALGESPSVFLRVNQPFYGPGATPADRGATILRADLPGGIHAGQSRVLHLSRTPLR